MLLYFIPFRFPSRSKHPPTDILKFLVITLSNQDKKFSLVRVDEDGALARPSESTKTCHNMNIIVQTTGGDESSINYKSKSPNRKIANITRAILLKSIHKKGLWLFAYQYSIWIYRLTNSRLCGDVNYFLWHGTRP